MKLNRRSFLKKALAAGSLAVGTGSLLSGCSGIRRSDLPDQNPAGHTANQLDAVGTSILYYASLAPSGHNAQPWYVRVLGQNEWIHFKHIFVDRINRMNWIFSRFPDETVKIILGSLHS